MSPVLPTCKHCLVRRILELDMRSKSNHTILSNCARCGIESSVLPLLFSNDKVHMSRFCFSCSPRPSQLSAGAEPNLRRRASSYLVDQLIRCVCSCQLRSYIGCMAAWSRLLCLSLNKYFCFPSSPDFGKWTPGPPRQHSRLSVHHESVLTLAFILYLASENQFEAPGMIPAVKHLS